MPRQTGSTDQPGLTHRTPTLASALTRGWRREIERRLEEARYHVGIDLGTTNSSVAVVDAQALLEGDTDAAVSVLPVQQECSDGAITSPLLASVVAEVAPGEWWVGRGARASTTRPSRWRGGSSRSWPGRSRTRWGPTRWRGRW